MLDPFGRSRLPREPRKYTREGRIELLGEAFQALRDGTPISREAAAFLGGAGMTWLEEGGDLLRDYLQVVKPKSHDTPQAVWLRAKAHLHEGGEA